MGPAVLLFFGAAQTFTPGILPRKGGYDTRAIYKGKVSGMSTKFVFVTGGVVFGLLTRAGVWGHAILKQLYTGKNYSLFCVQRAEELAAGGPVLLEHLQQAARDFGILEG